MSDSGYLLKTTGMVGPLRFWWPRGVLDFGSLCTDYLVPGDSMKGFRYRS